MRANRLNRIITSAGHNPKVGVIILAHGGKANWNEEVMKVRAEVDKVYPAEVALGMASRRTIQAAADKLAARGAERARSAAQRTAA